MIIGNYDYYKCGQCGQIHSVPKPLGMEGSEGAPLISICRKCCSENLQKAESIPCLIIQKGRNVQDMPEGDFMCYGFALRFHTRSGEPLKPDNLKEIVSNGTVEFYDGEKQLLVTHLFRVPQTNFMPLHEMESIHWLRPDHKPVRINLNKMHANIEWGKELALDQDILCDFVVEGDMIVEGGEADERNRTGRAQAQGR